MENVTAVKIDTEIDTRILSLAQLHDIGQDDLAENTQDPELTLADKATLALRNGATSVADTLSHTAEKVSAGKRMLKKLAKPVFASSLAITSLSMAQGAHAQEKEDGTRNLKPGQTLKVTVPGAAGGLTVKGQTTADMTKIPGFITAYPCGEAVPLKSDLNTDTQGVRSNRLIATANQLGEVCFFSSGETDLVVDIDGIFSEVEGQPVIQSIPNQRTDTRTDTIQTWPSNPGTPNNPEGPETPENGTELLSYSGPNPILLENVEVACDYKTQQGSTGIRRHYRINYKGLDSNNDTLVKTKFAINDPDGWYTTVDAASGVAVDGTAYFDKTTGATSLQYSLEMKVDEVIVTRVTASGVESQTRFSVNQNCTLNPASS